MYTAAYMASWSYEKKRNPKDDVAVKRTANEEDLINTYLRYVDLAWLTCLPKQQALRDELWLEVMSPSHPGATDSGSLV